MKAEKSLEVQDWGCIEYGAAYDRQKQFVEERLTPKSTDRLILVEHPPVVTIGRSGDSGDLCISKALLRNLGMALFESDRGGKATFHGPGQMVAYPIIKLCDLDLHWYVQTLLTSVADVLLEYGLKPVFKEGQPGIWVAGKKIASIGIAVKERITSHGVALNVKNDLTAFQWIIPCGHPGEVMTSMEKELGYPVDLKAVKDSFVLNFRKRFGYNIHPISSHPDWLRLPIHHSRKGGEIETLLSDLHLGTVCQSTCCPNLFECFNRGTATFMILGENCTRSCRFCAISKGRPEPLDIGEPGRVAEAVKQMGLSYVVITSVTRDDLPDGGAVQFVRTLAEIRNVAPKTRIEILVPDFKGSTTALAQVCASRPDMFNHNIETVPRLYPSVRPQALFQRSLDVLSFAADQGLSVKSGLMLGLGERHDEVAATLAEIKKTGCDCLTLGQYLAPSKDHVPVERYVPPSEFDQWASTARALGFREVAAGPLVRSSYRADEFYQYAKAEDCAGVVQESLNPLGIDI
ncbi:MAG: lipoyl synthase [Proteobacteria bacterium]|nr:lipoyl synthase [Pseudomonadota bacterium]MBU1697290.1 lipoyl synthase [Pseudomonadota bacterium]